MNLFTLRPLLTAALVISTALFSGTGARAYVDQVKSSSCVPSLPSGSADPRRLTNGVNTFGLRLLRRLAHDSAGGNVFISPASVSLALDMALDGAHGTTQSSMTGVLGLKGLSRTALREQAASLLFRLASNDAHVRLRVADALWARNDVRVDPTFLSHVAASFGARVTNADFADPSTVIAINRWVSCATNGTIDSIISRLRPSDVLVLLNALYFHGDWSSPFHNANTYNGSFTTGNGVVRQVPLMHATGTYAYAAGPTYQAITLPYGNGRYVMRIVLPAPRTSVSSLAAGWTPSQWRSWTGAMRPADVALQLPRFTVRTDRALTPDLAALGMSPAFARSANFSGICVRCFLSAVVHRTYLAVDERGTTAAAVTGVVVSTTAIGANHVTMSVNRPFLVAVADTRTGTLLFTGVINDPTSP